MPTYTYRCNACSNQFEVRQRINEPPVSACPVCGGAPRRVVSQVGIVFKGSGFYVTDNRGSSSRSTSATGGSAADSGNAAGSGSADKSAGGETPATGTEKPATGSETPPKPASKAETPI